MVRRTPGTQRQVRSLTVEGGDAGSSAMRSEKRGSPWSTNVETPGALDRDPPGTPAKPRVARIDPVNWCRMPHWMWIWATVGQHVPPDSIRDREEAPGSKVRYPGKIHSTGAQSHGGHGARVELDGGRQATRPAGSNVRDQEVAR